MTDWFKIILIAFFFFIVFAISFYLGYETTVCEPCQNVGLYEYECPLAPTLDYEFNCNNKFRNITGVYCIQNQTYELVCENKLLEKENG